MPRTRSISVKSVTAVFKRQKSFRKTRAVSTAALKKTSRTRPVRLSSETPLKSVAFDMESPSTIRRSKSPKVPINDTDDFLTNSKDLLISQIRSSFRSKLRNSGTVSTCSSARVAISDLRIPIMWREKDHFKNKGDSRRFALFAVFRVDSEVRDTSLICGVDRTCTDVAFSDVAIFENVSPDFQMDVELYSLCLEGMSHNGSASLRLKRRLKGSFSRSLGHKFGAFVKKQLENEGGRHFFELVAKAQLSLESASRTVGTHNMIIENTAEACAPPMLDHFCCRLMIEPRSSVEPLVDGIINIELNANLLSNVWCSLKAARLSVWQQRESRNLPALAQIQLTQGCVMQIGRRKQSLILSTPQGRRYVQYLISFLSQADLNMWKNALEIQINDCKSWAVYASQPGAIECPKIHLPLSLHNSGKNLYEEISITSPIEPENLHTMPCNLRKVFEPMASEAKLIVIPPPLSIKMRRKTSSATKKQRKSISSYFLRNAMETDV